MKFGSILISAALSLITVTAAQAGQFVDKSLLKEYARTGQVESMPVFPVGGVFSQVEKFSYIDNLPQRDTNPEDVKMMEIGLKIERNGGTLKIWKTNLMNRTNVFPQRVGFEHTVNIPERYANEFVHLTFVTIDGRTYLEFPTKNGRFWREKMPKSQPM